MQRADWAVLGAALIWGVAFLFQKTAMEDIGPFTFLFCRAAIAALALMPFALRETGGSLWPWAPLGGLAFFAGAGLQQSGIVTTTVTNASFLTALYVVGAPFVAWALFRRPPSRQVWIGAALALLGTWALTGGALTGLGQGDWLIICGSVLWAVYMIINQPGARAGRPLGHTATVFAVVAILALPVALTVEDPNLAALTRAAPEILFVGFLSSALTFGLFSLALRHVSGARAAVILSSEAIFAALAGMIYLGERLPPLGWVGAALILFAVLVAQRGDR